jgi:peptide/nickel transport system permease protein
VIIGAKYTILASVFIGFLRVLISLPIGFILGIYLKKYRKYFNGTVDSFHFIPLSILAYFLLYPILWEPPQGFSTTMTERFFLEIMLLTLLIVPILSSLLGNDIAQTYKEEYITSAKVMGAGKLRIMIKHIFPAIQEKLVIVFGQQIMQTLIIFIHLGLLKLFLGGTDVDYQRVNDPPTSMTMEWSGLIGDTFRYLQGAPWVPLIPILFFAATMFSIALMMEGYIQATSGYSYYAGKLKRKITTLEQAEIRDVKKSDFKKVEL